LTGTGKNGVRKESDLGMIGWVGLRLLLEKCQAILWTTDRDLRVARSLGSGLSAIGLRPAEAEGLSIYELFGNRDESFPPIAAHVAALRGEARELEYRWNGRLLGLRIEPLRDESGHCVGVVGVGLDVTDGRAEHTEAPRPAGKHDGKQDSKQDSRDQGRDHGRDPAREQMLRVRISELSDLLTTLLGTADRLESDGPSRRSESLAQVVRLASRGANMLRELRDALGDTPDREPPVPTEVDPAETILLVDDEPQVRGFVRRALEEHGYRVLETSAVDEALALGASYPGRIHLLLTDVVLPGMSGPQLAARLAPLRPEMRILYMTGYADDAIVHRGVISAGQALLVKPFTSLGLAHEVKKALRN
jgi:CheY-like chemotaxis protein